MKRRSEEARLCTRNPPGGEAAASTTPTFPLSSSGRCFEVQHVRKDGKTGVSPLAPAALFPSEHAPIMLAFKS